MAFDPLLQPYKTLYILIIFIAHVVVFIPAIVIAIFAACYCYSIFVPRSSMTDSRLTCDTIHVTVMTVPSKNMMMMMMMVMVVVVVVGVSDFEP